MSNWNFDLDYTHDDMKPCKFCGSTNVILVKNLNNLEYENCFYMCMRCSHETSCFETEEEAKEAWNNEMVM